MAEAFSTVDEALAAWSKFRAVVERLPAASMAEMEHLNGSLKHMRAAVTAAVLCAPADALGTHTYRKVHSLAPIEEG